MPINIGVADPGRLLRDKTCVAGKVLPGGLPVERVSVQETDCRNPAPLIRDKPANQWKEIG